MMAREEVERMLFFTIHHQGAIFTLLPLTLEEILFLMLWARVFFCQIWMT